MNSRKRALGLLESKFDDNDMARLNALMEREDAGTISRGIEKLLKEDKLEAARAFLEICHTLNPKKPFRRMMYQEFADYLMEQTMTKEKRERLLSLVRTEGEFLGNGQSAYWLFPITAVMAEIYNPESSGKRFIEMLKNYPHKTDFAKIYRFAGRETKRIKAFDFRSVIPYYIELIKDEKSFNDLVFHICCGEREGKKIGDLFSEAHSKYCIKLSER
jgi:hypothetical protein